MKTKSKSIFNIFTLFALLASLIGSAVFVTPAYAAEDYVVNTTADNTTNDAFCTLREAINAANNTGGSNTNCGPLSNAVDTITFSANGTSLQLVLVVRRGVGVRRISSTQTPANPLQYTPS